MCGAEQSGVRKVFQTELREIPAILVLTGWSSDYSQLASRPSLDRKLCRAWGAVLCYDGAGSGQIRAMGQTDGARACCGVFCRAAVALQADK